MVTRKDLTPEWGWLALWIGIVMATMAIVLAFIVTDSHPADECQEDGAWIAVEHHALDGVEDRHGVTRACRSIDDLIDMGIEVWIQNGGQNG